MIRSPFVVALFCLAGLTLHAGPVTYDYTGNPFTVSQDSDYFKDFPITGNITASIEFASAIAPNTTVTDLSAIEWTISSAGAPFSSAYDK